MSKSIEANLFRDPPGNREKILASMGRAVRDALCEHKQAGNPIAVWEDGKVHWIAAKDIVVPPDTETDETEDKAE